MSDVDLAVFRHRPSNVPSASEEDIIHVGEGMSDPLFLKQREGIFYNKSCNGISS